MESICEYRGNDTHVLHRRSSHIFKLGDDACIDWLKRPSRNESSGMPEPLQPRRSGSIAGPGRHPGEPRGCGKDRGTVVHTVGVSNDRGSFVPAGGFEQRYRNHEQRHRDHENAPRALHRASGVVRHDRQSRRREGGRGNNRWRGWEGLRTGRRFGFCDGALALAIPPPLNVFV